MEIGAPPVLYRTASYRPYWIEHRGRPVRGPVVDGTDSDGNPLFATLYESFGLLLQYAGTSMIQNKLRLLPGRWSGDLPMVRFGFHTFSGSPFMDIIFNSVGLNGFDKDYRGAGAHPYQTTGWYYPYLLGQSSIPWNNTRLTLSKEISAFGCRTNLTASTPGSTLYDYIRKLPFAVYWDETLAGGVGDFRLYNEWGGYPLLGCSYTGADCSALWRIASVTGPVTNQNVDCSVFAPDNGRQVELVMELVAETPPVVTGGTAYVKTPGVTTDGEAISIDAGATLPVRYRTLIVTNSTRLLSVTVPAGLVLNLYSRGWRQREMT